MRYAYICVLSTSDQKNQKERKRERKKSVGVLKMLHGVLYKKIVRKVTRTYTSRNRDKVKKRKRTRKIFSVTAKE